VEIAAPPALVFPHLVAREKRLRWMGALAESEALGAGRFHEVFEDLGQRIEIETEVVREEPPHLLEVRLRGATFEATSTQRLETTNTGTRLSTVVETGHTSRLARLAGPLVARRAQRQLEADLATLRELVEAEGD
jgi:uncharacterized protein YndB with AHSA1/START domain